MSTVGTGFDFDPITRQIVMERAQDVEPVLDYLEGLRQVTDGKSESGDMYHVGDIPLVIVEQYLNKTGVTFAEFIKDDTHIKRILNNPDFAKFRVWQGRF